MNYKFLIGLIASILMLNNALLGLISLPPIANVIVLGAGAIMLILNMHKGGMFGKLCLGTGIVLAVYTLMGLLSFIGIAVPFLGFLYQFYKYFAIGGAALLLIAAFLS